MLEQRRLLGVGTILAIAAVVGWTQVWGETGREANRDLKSSRAAVNATLVSADRLLHQEMAASRFGDRPMLAYETTQGQLLFALQLKLAPEKAVPLVAPQPRDYVVILDTSASKADGPLAQAVRAAELIARKLGAQDRLGIITANITATNLTGGLKTRDHADIKKAIEKLQQEYPSGAVNLKAAIEAAKALFTPEEGRQRAILFLGDGKSFAGPLTGDDRAKIATDLVARQIAWFSVPLGTTFEPANLHGLPSATGGASIRVEGREPIETVVERLLATVAKPIFYPEPVKLPANVKQFIPGTLPPLRNDQGTLVIGELEAKAVNFSLTLRGSVSGRVDTVTIEYKVPTADNDHFFLLHMLRQWQAKRDQPALLPADRTLSASATTNNRARRDLLDKADWAIETDHLDAATALYKQALDVDPASHEARTGLELVKQLRLGKTKEQLLERFGPKGTDPLARVEAGRFQVLHRAEAQPEAPAAPGGMGGAGDPVPEGRDILEIARARQALADQQSTQMIDDAIRRANRQVLTQPDDAHDFIKRTLEGVRNNPDISERVRVTLSDRLERSLQSLDRTGVRVKQDQNQNLALRAAADARTLKDNIERATESRIKERMRVFHTLMDQAREQQAYLQTEAIRTDLIKEGREVPPAVFAGYNVALTKYHYREEIELKRVREERWLAVLLEAERSHIPFPDEPPVEYPSAATIRKITRGTFDNWSDFSKDRKFRYEISGFGGNVSKRSLEIREQLSKPVDFQGFDDVKTTLQEALDHLSKRYNIPFEVNERAFKEEQVMDVMKTEIATPTAIPPMPGASLTSVLKRILSRVPSPSGATFLIRREAIEITNNVFAAAEKTLRTYPVADLVTPIPSPQQFNQQGFQNGGGGTLFGLFGAGQGALGALGALGGQLGALGGQLGALGALGGQLGALGALGGQLGALGALGGQLGALGGQLGALGAVGALGGQLGGQLGNMGQVGQIGQQGQLGAGALGGGLAGFQGGFGLSGNQQFLTLSTLIRQVVGHPGDWDPAFDPVTGQPLADPLATGGDVSAALGQTRNQLAFYPPALAMVVKGTSRIHTTAESPVRIGGPGAALPGGMGAINKPDKNPIVKVEKKELDAKTIWQDALARGKTEPGLIIAVADFLALNNEWKHASEFLKANLRQGIVVRPWVYESLAIALRESNADPKEIERAEVSLADLSPQDADGFLRASRAMGEAKNYERALAFAQQASQLQPNLAAPYLEALTYAELATDAPAMSWAAGNLLKQDWPTDQKRLHAKAVAKLNALVDKLNASNKPQDARQLLDVAKTNRQRDLVIKMSFQGDGDLDLKVTEPSGSVCSALNRQTVGGGILTGDSLADMTSESYQAAEAFSGEYSIRVERVYGKVLGNRAQLKVITHQGTPDEREQIITVDLTKNAPVTVKVENGRRKELAYIPPAGLQDASEDATATIESPDKVANKLRALAAPEVTGIGTFGIRGAAGGAGHATGNENRTRRVADEPIPSDKVLTQQRVKPFVQNSLEVTAQAVLASDRRSVRISFTPVFNATTGRGAPVVKNSAIPGN